MSGPESRCAVCVLIEAIRADDAGAFTLDVSDLPDAVAVWRGTPLCAGHLVDVATHRKMHVGRRRVWF